MDGSPTDRPDVIVKVIDGHVNGKNDAKNLIFRANVKEAFFRRYKYLINLTRDQNCRIHLKISVYH